MLEQTVSKLNKSQDEKQRRFLRRLRTCVVVVVILCEIFGFTAGSVYWEIDKSAFYAWCKQLVLMAIPPVIFLTILQGILWKMDLELDYTLQGGALVVHRMMGSRRHYLSLDVSAICQILPVRSIAEGSPEAAALRGAILAACNLDSEELVLIHCANTLYKGKHQDLYVVLEPSEEMLSALKQQIAQKDPNPYKIGL